MPKFKFKFDESDRVTTDTGERGVVRTLQICGGELYYLVEVPSGNRWWYRERDLHQGVGSV